MSEGEILDAAHTLIAPQLRSNYDRCLINSRLSECNAIQRLEEHLGSTQNSLSSLEGAHEEISVGARRNGRMSAVRRFFCLFVLFDLLLISLTWLSCIMLIGGGKLLDMLKMQILHYSLTTSVFDIVLAAFFRFVVLLLFYGLLQFNTTFFVALTTLATCVFLIVKVIYYTWNTASQPFFQVTLVLMSFVVAWAEAWFLDFRVLPQEFSALVYSQSEYSLPALWNSDESVLGAQATDRFSETLSSLLLDRNLRSPVLRHFLQDMASQMGAPTESNANFYSPLESPNSSSDESDERRVEKDMKKDQSNDYLHLGKCALEAAWSILKSPDWKLRKESPEGDLIYSKQVAHLGRVFLLRAKINIKPQRLLEELFSNVDKFVMWNKTILESRKVLTIDEHTDITYQISSPGGNGVVTSRDFVVLRHWAMKGDWFVLSGVSVPYLDLPENKQYIRGENGPCCWAMKSQEDEEDSCLFEFLLNTNLKGWIPQYVLEKALVSVLLEYSACLKEHCEKIRAKDCS